MMRHLHFVQSIETRFGGGLGSAAVGLHETLRKAGNESRLLTTGAADFSTNLPGVRSYKRVGPTPLFFAPELGKEAAAAVELADVIHGHGFYVYPNKVLGAEARKQGKALVYHPHGMFEPYILARSQRKKRLVHLLFENANFRHARLWRALTVREADQIRRQGIGAEIVVAPNAVKLEEFDALPEGTEPPFPCGRRTLLFMARLHPKKGVKLLQHAWEKLRPWKQDWQLVIAGPDECDLMHGLKQWAGTLEDPQSVIIPGSLEGPARVAALRKADLFVLPSYSEGFPMALLEAMACRLPVVATHECNLPDISEHGCGWLAEATEESVVQALSQALATSDADRQDRGEAGRRRIEAAYTWEKAAKPLVEACVNLEGRQ